MHQALTYDAVHMDLDMGLSFDTPIEQCLLRQPAFYQDPDSGPYDAWLWAHPADEEDSGTWNYQSDRSDLRQWGYVMWDRDRLEASGIFEKRWEDVIRTEEQLKDEVNEKVRQRAYLENSREQRQQVSRRGGSGWWGWGDESKIQCEHGGGPIKQPMGGHRVYCPQILKEARKVLSNMKLGPP